MNYKETVSWLFNRLPMYQNQGEKAYKKDLSNTILLANYLGNPETKFRSIHVGGTNGKGSTSHMLASVLQEAGYKVGLYTSPHFKDYRERIKINGKEISKEFVVQFVDDHMSFFEKNKLSFFEMTVGLAFEYFAKFKVDIAIIEVGLGGRLDSTNIINPELSIITNIGLDHIQFLGDTLPKIAVEKAGIIKQNIPIIIGETHPETESIFINTARTSNSDIYFADQNISEILESDLQGNYQAHNIKTVLQSIKILNKGHFKVSDNNLKVGLLNVIKNTNFFGRWYMLSEQPKVICDIAHNKSGLSYTMEQLKNENYKQLHIVFGIVNDKNIDEILSLLPSNAKYYLARPNIQRGLDVKILSGFFESENLNFEAFDSVNQAFSKAKSNAHIEDLIYIGGSTFIVAEIL